MNYITMSRKLISHYINTRKFFPSKKASKKDIGLQSGFDYAAYDGKRSAEEEEDEVVIDAEELVGAGQRFKNAEFDGLVLEKWYGLFVKVSCFPSYHLSKQRSYHRLVGWTLLSIFSRKHTVRMSFPST
jgi:hypothetical protein